MATTHLRSGSPSPSVEPSSKRLKTESNPPYHEGISSKFTPNLFDTANIARFKDEYKDSTPYKHAVIGQLFDHDLLKSVKDEILGQLGFTEKETDIYKARMFLNRGAHRTSCEEMSSGQPNRRLSLVVVFGRITTGASTISALIARCPILDVFQNLAT